MKEAIILKGPEVKIVDIPIPKAEPGQVVVKVVYSGSNPKDWVRELHYMQRSSCGLTTCRVESPIYEHRGQSG
jgi:hypothetical protein